MITTKQLTDPIGREQNFYMPVGAGFYPVEGQVIDTRRRWFGMEYLFQPKKHVGAFWTRGRHFTNGRAYD